MISVNWDDAGQSIIRLTVERGWTWDMYTKANHEAMAMGSDASKRYDVIVHIMPLAIPPANALREFRRTEGEVLPNTKLIILVNERGLVRMLVNMLVSVYKVKRWRAAKNLDEARAIIAADRAKAST